MKKIILASASPRRQELLRQVGLDFVVYPSDMEEKITRDKPHEAAMELALQKAEAIAARSDGDALIIGADTIVVDGNNILGKPKDTTHAKDMLRSLQGRTHQVYTGVAVIDSSTGGIYNFYEKTDVTMYPMTDEDIESYVSSAEPMDKAGAYGIQGLGAVYIESIHGDYNNVVGLPVAKVYRYINLGEKNA